MATPWSEEEIEYLKEHPEMTLKELTDGVNRIRICVRTESGVVSILHRKGLSYKRRVEARQWATDGSEDRYLKMQYSRKVSVAKIAIALDRSVSSIHSRLRKLKKPLIVTIVMPAVIQVSSWLDPEKVDNKAFIEKELHRLKDSFTKIDDKGRTAVFRPLT